MLFVSTHNDLQYPAGLHLGGETDIYKTMNCTPQHHMSGQLDGGVRRDT